MKTRDIFKFLTEQGFWFLRNSSHVLFTDGTDVLSVPHHREINIFLAKKIMKQAITIRSKNMKQAA